MSENSRQVDSIIKNQQDLLDQITFYFDAFNKSLITQTTKNEKLEKLLSTQDCWDNC